MKNSFLYGSSCTAHEEHIITRKLRSARKRGVREVTWGKFRFVLLRFAPLFWRQVYAAEVLRQDHFAALKAAKKITKGLS